jgi:hypothetical protein
MCQSFLAIRSSLARRRSAVSEGRQLRLTRQDGQMHVLRGPETDFSKEEYEKYGANRLAPVALQALPLTPDSASYAASTSPIADQSTMRRCHSIGRATTTTGHCYRSHSSSGASPLNRPKSVPQDRLTHSCGSTCRHRRPRSWGGFSRSHCTAHDPSADRGSAETRPRVEAKLVWYSSLSREGTALRIVHSKDHE